MTQKDYIKIAKQIADEGIVLLKNDGGALPLGEKKIAVFGAAQQPGKRAMDGTRVPPDRVHGFYNSLKTSGAFLDEELRTVYADWHKNEAENLYRSDENAHAYPEMELPLSVVEAARDRGYTTGVIVLARTSGENHDMQNVEGDYIISPTEREMIKNVVSVMSETVLVLNIGCAIDLSFLKEYKIDAILYLNAMGEIGMLSAAEILLGKKSPSGKLTFSFSEKYTDYSTSDGFGEFGGGLIQDYREDVFMGYRYFDTVKGADKNLLFPFGHGLSYTRFTVDGVGYTEKDGIITVSARVSNVGACAGKEVLQLYFAPPALSDGARLDNPAKSLCDFEKTKLLAPGESEVLTLSVSVEDMASYDDLGVLGESSAFVLEKGEYRLLLGTSSRDLALAGVHTEEKTRTVRTCHKIQTTLPERLTSFGGTEALPEPPYDPDRYHCLTAMGETVLSFEKGCKRSAPSFREMKAGDSVCFRVLPGANGTHYLGFLKDGERVDASALFDIKVRQTPFSQKSDRGDGSIFVMLPANRFEITLTAKEDAPLVDAIYLEKKEAKTVIHGSGESFVEPGSVYESSFGVAIYNYTDKDGNGKTGIGDFWWAGKYVAFKLAVEEEGDYEFSFLYTFEREDTPISKVMSVAVSNIVQPLAGEPLKRAGGVTRSSSYSIHLPKGDVHLKLVMESVPAPGFYGLYFKKCAPVTAIVGKADAKEKREGKAPKAPARLDSGEGVARVGIQLSDVYHGRATLEALLSSLTNRELATVVSGTGQNATPSGDVGCNSPVYAHGILPGQTSDGPCGLRQYSKFPTAYPGGMVLAATFNKALCESFGEHFGDECRTYDVDYLLGPSINLLRSPLGGRNCSYYSEDPVLAGVSAAYFIRGVQSKGVATVLKHYAANSTEYERLKSNSRISERALRMLYIRGFEIAVKLADPWAIMSSYNHANDVKVCEDYTMITSIPRDEWGWDGVFFTDWWNDSSHVEELKAGHDLKMATGEIDRVTEALDNGTLSRAEVERCAGRILRMLLKLGRVKELFEQEK